MLVALVLMPVPSFAVIAVLADEGQGGGTSFNGRKKAWSPVPLLFFDTHTGYTRLIHVYNTIQYSTVQYMQLLMLRGIWGGLGIGAGLNKMLHLAS
jgi:hypothetical protein